MGGKLQKNKIYSIYHSVDKRFPKFGNILEWLTNTNLVESRGNLATATDTADIIINEFEFFSYTEKFKYLGTIFTPALKDDLDIQRRITQASGALATNKPVLCNEDIPVNLGVWLYDATTRGVHDKFELFWGRQKLPKTQDIIYHRIEKEISKFWIFFGSGKYFYTVIYY